MFDQKKKKSLLLGLSIFLVLTVILAVFVNHLDKDAFEMLADTNPDLLILLIGFGILYILLDSCIYKAAYSDIVDSFSFGDSIALAGLRTFSITALFTGGAVPLQSYYLYKKGTMPGKTIGLITVLYGLQKASVLLYTTVLLLWQWRWVSSASSASDFLLFCYIFCSLAIISLFLLCTSKHVCRFVVSKVEMLPAMGKWPERKVRWIEQINALYDETHSLFHKKRKFAHIIALNILKLFVICSIPFIISKMMHMNAYTMIQAQTLCALMLLVSNSLPNIAGMGSTEFSFMLVFRQVLGLYTSAALIYYRCATYYFPFLISIVIVLRIQRRLAHLSRMKDQ